LPFEKKTWKSLDELDAGVCDGMTYEEIEVCLGARVAKLTRSKNILKITSLETRISLIIDTEVESRTGMLS
jgi:hypothetical protein